MKYRTAVFRTDDCAFQSIRHLVPSYQLIHHPFYYREVSIMNRSEALHQSLVNWSFGHSSRQEMARYETYLTAEDVERISGLGNVSRIPFHPLTFLGSDLNFIDEEGRKILCVEFTKSHQYEMFRIMMPKDFLAPVEGIGDEAFISPDQASPIIIFRKGDRAVSLTTTEKKGNPTTLVTVEQLIALAKLVASRLQE